MKLTEAIKKNRELKKEIFNLKKQKLIILSNITLNQSKDILEYKLNSNKVYSEILYGEYDNIINDSLTIKDELPIIFFELSNLVEGFCFEIESYDDKKVKVFEDKVLQTLDLLFENLSKSKHVLFNKFSHSAFTNEIYTQTKFELFVLKMNKYLLSNIPKNFSVIDIDKCISNISVKSAINYRNFWSYKSLYTSDFYNQYSNAILPVLNSLSGLTKKCIIIDCDNTLWKGIIGEDGLSNLEFKKNQSLNGDLFSYVHSLLKSYHEKGIILCLCSKNNEKDVIEFFDKNKSTLMLKQEDFIVKKINWSNKAININCIARELNIGLDSIIFLDDSSFEIDLIKNELPHVSTLQVPDNLFQYPYDVLKLNNLLHNWNNTKEDLLRNKMYVNEIKRKEKINNFTNIDSYIESLQIEMNISINDLGNIERLSQLTKKTNQFNLSTKRYELGELTNLIKSKTQEIISIDISDKFGDSGITGLAIINYQNDLAFVDTFLMSCRVLGRKIEYAFLNELINRTITIKKCKSLNLNFIESHKNIPIKTFLDSCVKENSDSMTVNSSNYTIKNNLKRNNNLISITWKKY